MLKSTPSHVAAHIQLTLVLVTPMSNSVRYGPQCTKTIFDQASLNVRPTWSKTPKTIFFQMGSIRGAFFMFVEL